MNIDQWKLIGIEGPGQYFVLLDDKGLTRAQGQRSMCEAVRQSYKFGDTKEQRLERMHFYGVQFVRGPVAPVQRARVATPAAAPRTN